MSTPKRVAWKDVVAPPLNWKAPEIPDQESEPSKNKQDKEAQSADK